MKILFGCYCKVSTEIFPDEYADPKLSEEDEIVKFLLSDLGYCMDEGENIIKGDKNIWYLATNEKHGYIQVDEKISEWGWGESSWERIEAMIELFRQKGMSDNNIKLLNEAVEEGKKNFSFMYDIQNYLISKQLNKEWKHPGNEGREKSTSFFNNVIDKFEEDGYEIQTPPFNPQLS